MARSIAVTFDYRCPFAYNGNAAVVAAVRAGSDIDFRFMPFSLDQAHIEEGEAAGVGPQPVGVGHGHACAAVRHSRCATRSPSTSSTRTSRCSRRATTRA